MTGQIAGSKDYVTYRADNKLLVLHDEQFCIDLINRLKLFFQITSAVDEHLINKVNLKPSLFDTVIIKKTGDSCLTGYLGNFSLTDYEQCFDQVLDLQQYPAISSAVKPFGYLHANEVKSTEIDSIVEKLVGLVGVFDKPKYFYQLPEVCAHSRRQLDGCNQCIDVCATDAIKSNGEQIVVDPHLCQGCGDCALTCPAGAINYQYPRRETLLQDIKQMIAQNPHRILLLHGENDRPDFNIPWSVNSVSLEALGTAGMDIWLSALAYGASQVWLYHEQPLTSESESAISNQVEHTNSILTGLGFPDQLIQLTGHERFHQVTANNIMPAVFEPMSDKRRLVRMALDHLAAQKTIADDFCLLPERAGFGKVNVITEDCTLCMACVSVCPEQALLAGTGLPQLKFVEAACVQCGICQQACPEHVITLESRYLYDSEQAFKPKLLHQQDPFHCIDCGQAFASRSMIDSILKKLEQHTLFQGDKLKQIQRCEKCKIVAQFGNQP
jgi:ferredoxin